MSKNKNKRVQPATLSPKKYIITRARTLPIYKCLITKDWEEAGIATILIMRKHVNGHVTAGFYLVDLLASVVKDTHFVFNEPEQFVRDLMTESTDKFEEIPYVLAHNIIYGAVALAEEYGFKPHRDFEITEYILEEDTDDIELIDIPFGMDGIPVIISKDDEEVEDEFQDEEPFYDYAFFTDDDWRNFLQSETELTKGQVFYVIEGLFQRWLDKYQPANDHQVPKLHSDMVQVTYDVLDPDLPYIPTRELGIKMGEILLRMENAHREDIPSIEKSIRELMAIYPGQPTLYNHLALCAQLKGDMISHKAIHQQSNREFPDYLYGKIGMANVLLNEDRLDEIRALLNNAWSLDEVMPRRKVFHITEFEDYYATLIRYFTLTGDHRKTQICLDILFEESKHEPDDYFMAKSSNVLEHAMMEFTEIQHQKAFEYLQELGIAPSIMELTRNNRH